MWRWFVSNPNIKTTVLSPSDRLTIELLVVVMLAVVMVVVVLVVLMMAVVTILVVEKMMVGMVMMLISMSPRPSPGEVATFLSSSFDWQ